MPKHTPNTINHRTRLPYFFQCAGELSLSEAPFVSLVHLVSNRIQHVPNKGIGSPYASIGYLRSLVSYHAYQFCCFYMASAYFALLLQLAHCSEFCDILSIELERLLPPGTYIDIYSAYWRNGFDHAYIKIKLPKNYLWEGGGRVRFCDAWHIKDNPSSKGLYTAAEINQILNNYGQGESPYLMFCRASKYLSSPIPRQLEYRRAIV